MAGKSNKVRVLVIGGGAVGVSCLYHLARAGLQDCLLLEGNELTSGSTWHAAGNVPTFSTSPALMAMQNYSAALYRGLGQAVDYPINYHVTGSLRLAHDPRRMDEFRKIIAVARQQGMDYELLGISEIRALYPFLETEGILGALWDPLDGDIDPAQLTQALAKGARDLGARIERFSPVRALRREDGDWVAETPQGEIRAEIIVNAAGYRAAELGRMMGREVPMMVMSHQYLLFDEIPELAAWTRERGHKLPLLRDVDASYYLRQEKAGMNLGPYERGGRAHWVTPDDPMPEDFSFQLYPDDLERLEWYLMEAVKRVPILGTAGLSQVINGPIPYTPDGNPLVGPMPGVPDAYEACVFSFGIAQAGGAGRLLAEWILKGRGTPESWACDPRRFTDFADPDYCLAKGLEVYGHEYAMQFPRQTWPAGRDRRLSAAHAGTAASGAVFGPTAGWERALWYAEPGDDLSPEAMQTWERDGPWAPRVAAECLAVRDQVGLLDLPGLSRFEVSGPQARVWLGRLITGRVPREGRVGLGYFCDEEGRILSEMTVLALGGDRFWLTSPAAAAWHDRDWLTRHLPSGGGVTLVDVTADWSCHLLTGPLAREVLAAVEEGSADLAAPWLGHQEARIAGVPLRLVRMSFAGELGWELHVPVAAGGVVWAALIAAGASFGLRPFGLYALESLRLEKAYRGWKQDLSSDYTLIEAGLARFIDWEKGDFIGRAALWAEQQAGAARRFAVLVLEDHPRDPPPLAPIWSEGERVGQVTSAGYGYRLGRLVALAMLPADLVQPGQALEVEVFGHRLAAEVAGDGALWDPDGRRMRG